MMRRSSVFIFLTEQCNLSCSHCYVSSSPSLNNAMPRDTVVQVLDIFGAAGVEDFRLIGGEPTIHPQFEGILNMIAERGYKSRFVSNGKSLIGNLRAKSLLAKTDVCWISAYGTTPQRHAAIGGIGAVPLLALERWIGSLAAEGFAIGVSILLAPGDLAHIDEVLNRCDEVGIRRVRFLPLEPDGRALLDPSTTWSGWAEELQLIYESLVKNDTTRRFDVVSINDPFDLGSRFASGPDSCLLHTRQMWSIAPNGDVYSCCFNVFQSSHKVANVRDSTLHNTLSAWRLPSLERPCRAFESGYWADASPQHITCPISAISVSSTRSLFSIKAETS